MNGVYTCISSSASKCYANLQSPSVRRSCIGLSVNLVCELMFKNETNLSVVALALNVPGRFLNISNAIRKKNVLDMAFQISAIAALYLPYGIIGSMAIDCISAGKNLYDSWNVQENNERTLVCVADQANAKNAEPTLLKKIFSQWPNAKSESSFLGLSTNGAFLLAFGRQNEAPSSAAVLLNAPVRLFSILDEVKEKNFLRVSLRAASFAALFFPYGLGISMGFDCILEVKNFFDSCPFVTKALRDLLPKQEKYPPFKTIPDVIFRREVKSREEALEMLGFPATATIRDIDKIEPRFDNMSKYKYLIKDLRERELSTGPYFGRQFYIMIGNFKNAYNFIKNEDSKRGIVS